MLKQVLVFCVFFVVVLHLNISWCRWMEAHRSETLTGQVSPSHSLETAWPSAKAWTLLLRARAVHCSFTALMLFSLNLTCCQILLLVHPVLVGCKIKPLQYFWSDLHHRSWVAFYYCKMTTTQKHKDVSTQQSGIQWKAKCFNVNIMMKRYTLNWTFFFVFKDINSRPTENPTRRNYKFTQQIFWWQ